MLATLLGRDKPSPLETIRRENARREAEIDLTFEILSRDDMFQKLLHDFRRATEGTDYNSIHLWLTVPIMVLKRDVTLKRNPNKRVFNAGNPEYNSLTEQNIREREAFDIFQKRLADVGMACFVVNAMGYTQGIASNGSAPTIMLNVHKKEDDPSWGENVYYYLDNIAPR